MDRHARRRRSWADGLVGRYLWNDSRRNMKIPRQRSVSGQFDGVAHRENIAGSDVQLPAHEGPLRQTQVSAVGTGERHASIIRLPTFHTAARIVYDAE